MREGIEGERRAGGGDTAVAGQRSALSHQLGRLRAHDPIQMNQGRCDALALTLGGADGGVRGRPALGEHLVQRLRAPAPHHCVEAERQRKNP
jgi:hypothetical protein